MTARSWRPDGPGSFQAPAGVRAVTDRPGRRCSKDGARWTCTGSRFIRWRVLVAEHGPVTEAGGP
ncbi:hypothetical protein [Streptomyces sp. NPDC020298]|uniref:hypothetical protein n=1 Tax=unclassified Streptomyces TaxID=2593676 RepID=UPI003404DADE